MKTQTSNVCITIVFGESWKLLPLKYLLTRWNLAMKKAKRIEEKKSNEDARKLHGQFYIPHTRMSSYMTGNEKNSYEKLVFFLLNQLSL